MPNEIIVSGNDFISGGGSSARQLMENNFDFNRLRTNAILQKDEWVNLDRRVIKVAGERLVVVNDLISNGLVYNLGGLGVTMSEYQTESDMSGASISMEPDSAGNRDNLSYGTISVPIPVIHKNFGIGIRQLMASRQNGSNIDLATADVAARKVATSMEDLVIRGYSQSFNGNKIYGYITHPNRITGVAKGSWSADIENVYDTVLDMITAAEAAGKYGPYNLYIPGGLSNQLYKVYNDGSGQTVMHRLQNITSLKKVSIADRLPTGNLVLVQMSSDTVDLAVAQTLTTVEWTENGGMSSEYKILVALAPRLKPDANKNLGVVHFTGA